MNITRPPGARAPGNREFQRSYKAHLSCRQKKSKCDLGNGANGVPVGPPCMRCRREQRRSEFSDKRSWARTKKANPSPLRRRSGTSEMAELDLDENCTHLAPTPFS
ncbi:hypothetical protein V8E54_003123 [Elaphomyces granulatus]